MSKQWSLVQMQSSLLKKLSIASKSQEANGVVCFDK